MGYGKYKFYIDVLIMHLIKFRALSCLFLNKLISSCWDLINHQVVLELAIWSSGSFSGSVEETD